VLVFFILQKCGHLLVQMQPVSYPLKNLELGESRPSLTYDPCSTGPWKFFRRQYYFSSSWRVSGAPRRGFARLEQK